MKQNNGNGAGIGRRSSLKYKITAISCLICVCVAVCVGVFSVINVKATIAENARKQLTVLAEQVSGKVEASIEADFSFLEALATNEKVFGAGYDEVEQKKYLLEIAAERGVDGIGVADADGRTLTADLVTWADVSERDYFKKAMEGTNYISDPLEDSTNAGVMILMVSVPLVDESGQIQGVLYMKKDGAALSDITDQVVFGETGSAYMINREGTNIAHPVREKVIAQENATKLVKDNPSLQGLVDLINHALKGGSGYSEYEYEGVRKCVGYAEIEDYGWHVMVSAAYSEMYAGVKRVILSVVLVCLVSIVLFGLVAYFFARGIVRPIAAVKEELEYIAKGDFTRSIPERILNVRDESGVLARSLQQTQDQLRETIVSVHESSGGVSDFADRQKKELNHLMSDLESVSATVEELAASSEETAATTEQMSNVAIEAQENLESVARLAEDGNRTSEEIRQRAHELEESSLRTKEYATGVYQQSMQTLQQAIEDAKQIEEIEKLSDAILSITSQTNLLALNASIEAARAGEAGRGFAVVASEIGHLAEDSRQSVGQIQRITGQVVTSVENLSRCAQDILGFIDETVMRDYENMTEIGRKYNEDAQSIRAIISGFDESAQKMVETFRYIVSALKDVAVATEESATGVTVIAQNSTEITLKANEVVELAAETMEKASGLSDRVSVFEV